MQGRAHGIYVQPFGKHVSGARFIFTMHGKVLEKEP